MRFLHRITSEKGFIDLHNHTNSSFGDEMNRTGITPLGLLEEATEYANRHNQKVTFALADHNNINGNREIQEAIKKNPEKYKNINFIAGCEYTVSTESLGTVVNDKGQRKGIIDGKVHMLAYDMDLENPTIKYLNDCMSTENKYMKRIKNTPVKTGSLIFTTKKWLEQNGIKMGIDEFQEDCPITSDFDQTCQSIKNLLIKKFNFDEEKLKSWHKFATDDQNLMRYAKLDVLELMSVVEKAGGYTVLAHPAIYKPSRHLINADFSINQNKIFADMSFTEEDEELNEMTLEEKMLNDAKMENFYDHVFKGLTEDAHNPITGEKLEGIVGFELLHCANQFSATKFTNMYDAGKRYGLYVTCGSDSHGNLHPKSLLSRVVPDIIEFEMINDKDEKLSHIAVVDNMFVNDLEKSHQTGERLQRDKSRSMKNQMTLLVTDYNQEYEMNLGEYRYAMEEILTENKQKSKGKGKGKGRHKHRDYILEEHEEEALLLPTNL